VPVGYSRRAVYASDGDEQDKARSGLSRHADQHGQPGIHMKKKGRNVEAVGLMREYVQRRKRILGANRPYFISSSNALAGWEAEQYGTLAPRGVAEG
jgi:hypothetical protein